MFPHVLNDRVFLRWRHAGPSGTARRPGTHVAPAIGRRPGAARTARRTVGTAASWRCSRVGSWALGAGWACRVASPWPDYARRPSLRPGAGTGRLRGTRRWPGTGRGRLARVRRPGTATAVETPEDVPEGPIEFVLRKAVHRFQLLVRQVVHHPLKRSFVVDSCRAARAPVVELADFRRV